MEEIKDMLQALKDKVIQTGADRTMLDDINAITTALDKYSSFLGDAVTLKEFEEEATEKNAKIIIHNLYL